jgi:hypothetical protein
LFVLETGPFSGAPPAADQREQQLFGYRCIVEALPWKDSEADLSVEQHFLLLCASACRLMMASSQRTVINAKRDRMKEQEEEEDEEGPLPMPEMPLLRRGLLLNGGPALSVKEALCGPAAAQDAQFPGNSIIRSPSFLELYIHTVNVKA